ncbi:hypothetical protein ISCGN_000818 [Ixodes scapularis]
MNKQRGAALLCFVAVDAANRSTARSFRFLPLEGEDPCFASDKLQRSKTWRRGSDVRDLGFTGRLNEHMMAEESWSSTTAEKSRLQHG